MAFVKSLHCSALLYPNSTIMLATYLATSDLINVFSLLKAGYESILHIYFVHLFSKEAFYQQVKSFITILIEGVVEYIF